MVFLLFLFYDKFKISLLSLVLLLYHGCFIITIIPNNLTISSIYLIVVIKQEMVFASRLYFRSQNLEGNYRFRDENYRRNFFRLYLET